MSGAPTARDVRRLLKGASASLSGRTERGPDRRVRRNSYDVDSRHAQVFRPIGDGSTAGALGWIDCLLKTVTEWDDLERKKGGARPIGFHGIRVLETLLGRRGVIQVDFRTGRLEPAIDTIARVAGLCRTTVVRALARLNALKILHWVRRTQRAATAGQSGPQLEQVSNAYWFDLSGLPARVLQRFRDLWNRKRVRREGTVPPDTPKSAGPSPELAAILGSIEKGIAAKERGASPPCGQYPSSEIKG
jgi:hypothetical protein